MWASPRSGDYPHILETNTLCQRAWTFVRIYLSRAQGSPFVWVGKRRSLQWGRIHTWCWFINVPATNIYFAVNTLCAYWKFKRSVKSYSSPWHLLKWSWRKSIIIFLFTFNVNEQVFFVCVFIHRPEILFNIKKVNFKKQRWMHGSDGRPPPSVVISLQSNSCVDLLWPEPSVTPRTSVMWPQLSHAVVKYQSFKKKKISHKEF